MMMMMTMMLMNDNGIIESLNNPIFIYQQQHFFLPFVLSCRLFEMFIYRPINA